VPIQVATTLTAAPQLVLAPHGPRGVGAGVVSATLTGGGEPFKGETITFKVGSSFYAPR
jgi:hypothetical protein